MKKALVLILVLLAFVTTTSLTKAYANGPSGDGLPEEVGPKNIQVQ